MRKRGAISTKDVVLALKQIPGKFNLDEVIRRFNVGVESSLEQYFRDLQLSPTDTFGQEDFLDAL